jgi:hypothetical protein
VIVLAEFTDNKIDIPISRADNQASVIACIAVDGYSLTLMVIIPRKTVKIELYECGFMPDAYSFVWQEHGFCIRLFFERLQNTFISFPSHTLCILAGCALLMRASRRPQCNSISPTSMTDFQR